MNLTSFKASLRKYSAIVGVLAVVVVGAITMATIWFLNQAEGPVAPTAPQSQPQAAGNVCSVQWIVRNDCNNFQVFNADTGAEIPAGTSVAAGTKVQWACKGLEGTNFFKYRYRTSATEDYKLQSEGKTKNMPDPANPRSTVLDTTGMSYLQVFCRPFAGDFGAPKALVEAKCTRVISFSTVEEPPKQCNEACTTDAQCSGTNQCISGMCRNPSCSGETDCTCAEEPPKQCNEACTSNAQCGGGNQCIAGMCRNAACSGETDCTCNTPDALSCVDGAFNQTFTNAGLDAKLQKLGDGGLTIGNGVGTLEVTANQPPYEPRALLNTLAPITGNLMSTVNFNSLTINPVMNTGVARLQLISSDQATSYRLEWRKGANGTSQIVSDQTNGSSVVSGSEKSVNIPGDSQVRFRIERENTTVRMYYRLGSGNDILHREYTGASMPLHIRSGIVSADTSGTLNIQSVMDNYALACIPAQCSASCTSDSQCVSGLSCISGMCRNPSCSGEADCTCPNEPVKSSDLVVNGPSCTNNNIEARVTVKENNAVKSGITVTFRYNGETKSSVSDANGLATATFTYAANQTVVVEISDGWAGHSRGTNYELNCPGGTPTPTATPTATPTGTPGPTGTPIATPTPPASCNNSCVTSSDCSSGLTCSGGQCRNASCTNKTNCVCDIAQTTPDSTPTPTPTPTTLPVAGSTGQTLALVAIGVTVVGLGVTRFRFLKK